MVGKLKKKKKAQCDVECGNCVHMMCANDERMHVNPGSKRENKDKGASFRLMCNHSSGPFAKLLQKLENVLHLFFFSALNHFEAAI